jgi:homospermidine synthase
MISLKNKKVMFLGYGAVAKCVWNYFSSYFSVKDSNVYLVDKTKTAFYGPKIRNVNKIEANVGPTNFIELLEKFKFREGDILIDLTFASSTYFFIQTCLTRGIHYMNTSIEDESDLFHAGSIDYQQQLVKKLIDDFKKDNVMRGSVLTECGQNPGLIQHYVLYALNQLYQMAHPHAANKTHEYRRSVLTKMIDKYKIGTIFMSEIDKLRTSRPMRKHTLYNTWSVAGFVAEGLDCAEIVHGPKNKYIKPKIESSRIHKGLMRLYEPYQNHGKQVMFLKENGRNSTLPTIAPVLTKDNKIKHEVFHGSLIHHGESFELANYFGKNAPFMSYVYKYSPYLDRSLDQVEKDYHLTDRGEFTSYILSDPSSFCVFDNIGIDDKHHMNGFDSIGCTILCGDKDVERIFWCGTILSNKDDINPLFTPTVVQVAAGVLSGLSYIIEKEGFFPADYYQPCDLSTEYILNKAMPLLGKFFFTEIPVSEFNERLEWRLREKR